MCFPGDLFNAVNLQKYFMHMKVKYIEALTQECSKRKVFLKILHNSLGKQLCAGISFFFYQGFLHRHWRFTGQKGKGRDHLLFHSTTFTRSRTVRHLFATLQVRWLSRIFNRNACVYRTATQWDLPPYRISFIISVQAAWIKSNFHVHILPVTGVFQWNL